MFYKQNDEHVAAEEFDGEFVLINFARGTYFSLRHAAVDVWRQFRNGANPVEVYSDLQDLIVLDPVHEVDYATGWPRRAAGGDGS